MNSGEPVPKEESSNDDLIDLTRLSGKEIIELAKGKYGKRDRSDFSINCHVFLKQFGIKIICVVIVYFFIVYFFIFGPMLLDPLFLYVPIINENIKCFTLDEKLKKITIVLRSFTDLPYLLKIIYHVLRKWCKLSFMEDSLIANEMERYLNANEIGLLKSPIHSILAVLPIPQIVILILLPKTRNSRSLNRMKFLNLLILLQYVPRVYPMYKLCTVFNKEARERSKEFAKYKQIWIPGVLNFFTYIYAGHSDIVGTTYCTKKVLMCFSWGLQNMSSFASNLNSSTNAWESVFVIFVSISGLVLFMYLLGHVQIFMQAISKTSKIRQRVGVIRPRIEFMVSEYGLKKEVKNAIWKLVREALEEDEDRPTENIFSLLPLELQKHMKRHLFLATLRKLPGLESKDRQVLDAIMENLEPGNYSDGSYIIREGEPLDRMLFITQGIALAYKTSTTHLEKGDVYGKELIGWAATSTPFSGLPISDQTVKSHEKVEVFAIRAATLKRIVSDFSTHFNREDIIMVEIN